MTQWIAVLVALVCFSGSSLSRNWVVFDDNDDPESWQADPVDYRSNRKSRYYSGEGSWESDENYDYLGSENGNDQDKSISSNNGYHKDISSHANDYHDHHQVGLHHDHGYNDNWGHLGHHTETGFPGQPDHYWRSIGHHSLGTSDQHSQNWGSKGHHGQTEHTGQPGENWVSHGHQNQNGSPDQHGQNWAPHGDNTQSAKPGHTVGPSRVLPQNNVNRPEGYGNDADRIVFPDFNNQVSTTRSPPTNRPATTTARTTTTDRALSDLICIRTCPTTSEYNPVCGTNDVTYNNPGALQCARNCGFNVGLARQAPCPRAIPPTTTVRSITNPTTRPTLKPTHTTTMRTIFPTVNLTHFTNINVNVVNRPGATPIPVEILQSVFGNLSPTSTTEEPEFDIDHRRKP